MSKATLPSTVGIRSTSPTETVHLWGFWNEPLAAHPLLPRALIEEQWERNL